MLRLQRDAAEMAKRALLMPHFDFWATGMTDDNALPLKPVTAPRRVDEHAISRVMAAREFQVEITMPGRLEILSPHELAHDALRVVGRRRQRGADGFMPATQSPPCHAPIRQDAASISRLFLPRCQHTAKNHSYFCWLYFDARPLLSGDISLLQRAS